jgi:class 3 adenylate cyclase/tetratricopeptide (TPR) repeat protein
VKCPTCARRNRKGAQFCDACGGRLAPLPQHGGERRQLTALFCDLVGYTPLSETLDEEDLHTVVRVYQKTVRDVIARWDGRVESTAADGVSAYFGYPAHEDDAERGVRASLDLISALRQLNLGTILNSRAPLPALAIRVGVHTGPVVVGDVGTGEHGRRQALGRAMNIAARLEQIASPGAVVISEATQRLVSGMFVTEDLGLVRLKGIEERLRAFVVVGSTGQRSRLDAGAAPFMGRARELAELQSCWHKARRGEGQVVLISGDAGIGKSRLVRQFVESLEGERRTFEWRCSPFHTSTPLHPLTERLRQHLGIEREPLSEPIAPRIRALVAASGRYVDDANFVEASELVADLVSPPSAVAGRAPSETPAVRRFRTLDLLCELARAQAQSRPCVVLVEDMHWADPSTVELIGRLLRRCSDVPLLLLLTSRPDFARRWQDAASAHTVSLEPLSSDQCADLFDALIGPRTVDATVRSALLSRSDGVPLFVEELTRALRDSAADRDDVLAAIPDTLQGLLVSRLDRLSPRALATIHLASALSREFRFDVLASVSNRAAAELHEEVDELVAAGLVYQRRTAAGESYVFKHALVAEAAYDSILRSDRRRLHAQIAHRLSEAFPAIAIEQPELLARHYGEAGEPEKAVEYWRDGGDAAIARGAYQEAVRHFDHGLELLAQIANDRVRLQCEIELTVSKGTALFSMLGYADPHVEATFARALSLCEQERSSPTLRVLYGLWAVHVSRSNRDAVDVLLPRFQDLARSGDPVALLTAHANAGVRAFFAGEFESCLTLMTEATRWYATTEHSTFLSRHGYGGGLYPFAWRMWSLSILGRAERAFAAEDELRALADQAHNPYGLAIAGGFRVNLARDRRDPAETLELADRQIEYARRQMLPLWQGVAHCSRGWARACLGVVGEGIAEIRMGLQYLDMVGLRATYPYHLSALVDALLMAGDVDSALGEVKRGLTMCDAGLDRFYEAELLRLQAECLRRSGDLEGAESGYQRALAIACRQSATLFALRAAEGLIRVSTELGKEEAARQELIPVFTDLSAGAETTDRARIRQLLGAFA